MVKKKFAVAWYGENDSLSYSRGCYTFDEAWFIFRNKPILPAKARDEVLKKIDDYAAKYYPDNAPKEFEKLKYVLGKLLSNPNYPGDEFDVGDFYFDDEMISVTFDDGVLDVSRDEDIPDQSLFPEVLIEAIKEPKPEEGTYRFLVDTHDGKCRIDLELFRIEKGDNRWEEDLG